MESVNCAVLYKKLLRKQKCLIREIRNLKPLLNRSEEAVELSYSIFCEYSKWFFLNRDEMLKLSLCSNGEVSPDDCQEIEEDIAYFKSIYEAPLVYNCTPILIQDCTNISVRREINKQRCLLNVVSMLEPANCLNQEEAELYKTFSRYL